jgi:flagellar biogenesis protein FliO
MNEPLIDFLKTMALLGGILALAWAATRYWLPKLTLATSRAGHRIEVLARQPLEPRKTLYLVRVGTQTLLISATGEHVALLDRVQDPATTDPATEEAAA